MTAPDDLEAWADSFKGDHESMTDAVAANFGELVSQSPDGKLWTTGVGANALPREAWDALVLFIEKHNRGDEKPDAFLTNFLDRSEIDLELLYQAYQGYASSNPPDAHSVGGTGRPSTRFWVVFGAFALVSLIVAFLVLSGGSGDDDPFADPPGLEDTATDLNGNADDVEGPLAEADSVWGPHADPVGDVEDGATSTRLDEEAAARAAAADIVEIFLTATGQGWVLDIRFNGDTGALLEMGELGSMNFGVDISDAMGGVTHGQGAWRGLEYQHQTIYNVDGRIDGATTRVEPGEDPDMVRFFLDVGPDYLAEHVPTGLFVNTLHSDGSGSFANHFRYNFRF